MIGTENSHITHFTKLLNVEERHTGVRATALVGGHSERNLELAELGGIGLIVDEPKDLLGQVDAAIISTRDGARHLADARPLIETGMPVLVDKPLAASTADAEELIRIAQSNSALLLSCSALRFVPEMEYFPSTHETGDLRHLHVIGPADPDSEYSGLFFYGIHHVEAALEILGDPIVEPEALDVVGSRHRDLVTAAFQLGDAHVTLSFITPTETSRVPFHATAVFERAVVSHDLTLGADYNAPALAEFIGMIESGRNTRTPEQLRSPVQILAALVTQIERNSR